MPFIFTKTKIPDVVHIEPKVFKDDRGFFMETYKKSDFEKNGIDTDFVQDNHSKSTKGVLRGLHYQMEPMEQGKLVRCIRGKIWDVAVDIRKGSPWYAKWVAVELSEKNKQMLWVPPGFAHGFITIEDNTEVVYKVTKEYAPNLDRGIIWNDSTIAINWPVKNPILSKKDMLHPNLEKAENNFSYKGGDKK